MKLSIKERIQINYLIPNKGNLIEMTLAKSIMDKTTITAEEVSDLNIRVEGDKTVWKDENEKPISVHFNEAELEILNKNIDKLDKEGKVTIDIMDLIKKIKRYTEEYKLIKEVNKESAEYAQPELPM